MDRRDVQLSLVQDLLSAPGNIEGWQAFLLHLCDALRGSAANFISHDFASIQASVSVTAHTAPEALADYGRYWHQEDPWAHSPHAAELRTGAVVLGDRLIGRDAMRRTAYYDDFGRRYGIFQCLAGMIEVSPKALSCISINRSEQRDTFDDGDSAFLSALMPSVRQALQIHRRLEGAELMATHAADVLDRLPHGVILLSAAGAVLSSNRAAGVILRSRDGLTVDTGELRAATVGVTSQLRALIGAAIRTSQGVSIEPDQGLLLPRPSGRRPLSLIVAPLPSKRRVLVPDPLRATAVIFVTDPERTPLPDAALIRTIFRLTTAESQLVRCLAAGLSLEQAAVQLGLRPATVRTRLKDVFQKTNTHRQADLVRLVLTNLASLVR
jgi:DNA-binding CsgD family transcriptional regulator